MFKKETKEKLKQVWIEASPYIVVLALGVGAIVLKSNKAENERTDIYREYWNTTAKQTHEAHEAYLETLKTHGPSIGF